MGRNDAVEGQALFHVPQVVVEPTVSARAQPARVRCVVRLHGKGGDGGATTTSSNGWLELHPRGNATGWGGYQWLYFPASSYAVAVATVDAALTADGCTVAVVDGFSNGGAFAAKLSCRSERFGGRVVGYVVDDPVPDHGTDGCAMMIGISGKSTATSSIGIGWPYFRRTPPPPGMPVPMPLCPVWKSTGSFASANTS